LTPSCGYRIRVNNPIICRFCQNPAEHKPLPEAETLAMEIYFCFTCGAEYSTYSGRLNIYYSLYTFINNRLYRWSTGGVSSYLYYISVPGIPGVKVNSGVTLVTSFDSELLNITPQNINEKIKTILMFL
jgi:hypothetical protein